METYKFSEVAVRELIKKRRASPDKDEFKKNLHENNIKRALETVSKTERSEEQIKATISWLEKISEYVPISNDKELEEIIKLMTKLSEVRARFNFLYDKPGLQLMKDVRECMIKYLVVLSEIRAHRKEYFAHWFTEETWIYDWSRVILDLLPSDTMERYSFPDITTQDFLHLLALELACADTTSELENPMIRMQDVKGDSGKFIVIPTEAAAKKYQNQVSKIIDNQSSFAKWVEETLNEYNLPKIE